MTVWKKIKVKQAAPCPIITSSGIGGRNTSGYTIEMTRPTLKVQLDKPVPCIQAAGIAGKWLSQYSVQDDSNKRGGEWSG